MKSNCIINLMTGISVDDRLIFTVQVNNGDTVGVGVIGTKLINIDWSDGTVDIGVTQDAPTHTYLVGGTYKVYVRGYFARLYFYNVTGFDKIIGIDNLVDQTGSEFYVAFFGLTNLKYIRGKGFKGLNIQNAGYGFSTNPNLEEINLPNFEGNSLKDCSYMFQANPKLSTLILTSLTGIEITSSLQMFYNNPLLTGALDLPQLVCSKSGSASYMFAILGVTGINAPKLNLANAINANYMAFNSPNLEAFYAPLFNGEKINDFRFAFYECPKLSDLVIGGFTGANISQWADPFYHTNLTVESWSNFVIEFATENHINNFTINGDGTKHNANTVAAIATLQTDGITVIDGGLQ